MKLVGIFALCIVGALGNPYGQTFRSNYDAPAIVVKTAEPYGAPAVVKSVDYGYSKPEVKVLKKEFIPIVLHKMNDDNYGTYSLDVKTGNGISQVESGMLKNLGDPEGPTNVKAGSYSYVGPDGVTYTIDWTADERGFIARGAHLPVPPPIPEEIKKSLEMPRVSSYGVRTETFAPLVRSSLY